MFDTLILLLFLTAGTLGVIAAFALLFSKTKPYSSSYLALLLLSLALISFHGLSLDAHSQTDFSLFSAAAKSFIVLAAPCSFIYVRSVLSGSCKTQKHDWLHMAPFIVFLCFSLFLPEQIKLDLPLYRYGSLLRILWLSYAVFQTVKILNSSAVQKNGAAMADKDLGFVRVLNLNILILFSFLFLYHFLLETDGIIDKNGCIAAACALTLTIAALFCNSDIFYSRNHLPDIPLGHAGKNFKKARQIRNNQALSEWLSPERRKESLLTIEYHMNFRKCFLIKGIALKDLADDTGIPANIISHLINSELGLSFKDYINSKRIEYFIENTNNPSWKDLNVLGMALNCGFGSRTSCFRAFLKQTGKAPSHYFQDIGLRSGA